MKLVNIKKLKIPELRIITYQRLFDLRGYFSEPFRESDFQTNTALDFMKAIKFNQSYESFSKKGVIRGLHFQWNPYMGKMVRTIRGSMVDLVLDIRIGSPTFGKIIAVNMSSENNTLYGEWIWIPPGFAHGNFFTEDTVIEYFCSGDYNPGSESGISPLADDLDWTLCEPELKKLFDTFIKSENLIISDKDKNAVSLSEWKNDKRSDNFFYGKL